MNGDRVRVDSFMVADAVQEVAGKLYILGGGWSRYQAPGPLVPGPAIGLAVRVVVPWNETNRPLSLLIQLFDPDGKELLAGELMAQLTVGRPPDATPGTEQAAAIALTFGNPAFQIPGTYAFAISLEDQELNRARFEVTFAQ